LDQGKRAGGGEAHHWKHLREARALLRKTEGSEQSCGNVRSVGLDGLNKVAGETSNENAENGRDAPRNVGAEGPSLSGGGREIKSQEGRERSLHVGLD